MNAVLRRDMIFGGMAASSGLALFSISAFHCSSQFSSLARRDLAPVMPKSSHSQPVTRPSTPSTIFLKL